LEAVHLNGRDVFWRAASGPVASISADGQLTAVNVYQRSSARIEGRYPGKSSFIDIDILNVGDDDFGLYAKDNIPDLWQVRNFGENNPQGVATADPDGDGQNNLFEYFAGLAPTNASSRFTLAIADLPDLPNQKALILSPRLEARRYVIEYSINAVDQRGAN
jgi:hypothetical protein